MAINLILGLVVLIVTGLLLNILSEARKDENRQLSARLAQLEAENSRLRQENRALKIRLGDAPDTPNTAAG